MTPLEIHICIAKIARKAMEIQKIMEADKLSYSKRIDILADDIFNETLLLHEEIFPGYLDEKNENE